MVPVKRNYIIFVIIIGVGGGSSSSSSNSSGGGGSSGGSSSSSSKSNERPLLRNTVQYLPLLMNLWFCCYSIGRGYCTLIGPKD